jgi:hypothetical protein
MVDPFDALRLIKDVGYEALEVCAADAWPSSPERFSTVLSELSVGAE